jgi:hypothetical protein
VKGLGVACSGIHCKAPLSFTRKFPHHFRNARHSREILRHIREISVIPAKSSAIHAKIPVIPACFWRESSVFGLGNICKTPPVILRVAKRSRRIQTPRRSCDFAQDDWRQGNAEVFKEL